MLELDNWITNNLKPNNFDKNFIAVVFPCPICPSKIIVELRDKPKWITFSISINILVNAGFVSGYSFLTDDIKALVIIDLTPFKLSFCPKINGLVPFGISILICFSLLDINKYLYNLSLISSSNIFSISLFCSIIDLKVK